MMGRKSLVFFLLVLVHNLATATKIPHLTLNVYKSPFGINWETPAKLSLTTALKTGVAGAKEYGHTLGHVSITLDCANGDGPDYTGMERISLDESKELTFDDLSGLGTLVHNFKGSIESPEHKAKAVSDYLAGKPAPEVAAELGCETQHIYRWKTLHEEKQKDLRLDELMDEGNSKVMAEKLREKELEIEMYQKKVAEQSLIIDLLKKSRIEGISVPESELTGLIRTSKKSVLKRKGVKS
jgi:transposase-like protein